MIGLFGLWMRDRDRPVDLAPMATPVDRDRYRVTAGNGVGSALGGTAHGGTAGWSAAERDGTAAIVTGDIFNAVELLHDLQASDATDPATTVLALYRADALDRLAQANGLFAAALYDRPKHRLTLVTDRVCGYPLHLHASDARVAFAGQILCLLAEGSVPRKASSAGLAQLFTMQRTIARDTNIAAVEALPAATILTIGPEGRDERTYWQLDWTPGYRDERDAARDVADALRRAVERQVNGEEHRAGLLLSGGLDSRMILGAAPPGRLACFTTASYADNPELALARDAAAGRAATFRPMIVEPARTLEVLDRTTEDSNGLYPASTQISAFMDEVHRHCDVALTGHGLDYTLRGYYLPTRFLRVAGSSTRLPVLRPIPRRPTGRDVLNNLRQGPPLDVVARIVLRRHADAWWSGQAERLDRSLKPWLEGPDPLNAWDAFILQSLSKHYAFTGMMAVRAAVHLGLPAYDRELFEVYLRLTPRQRVSAGAGVGALRHIDPQLAGMANANTGFRADLGPWREVGAVLALSAGRRLGIVPRVRKPSAMHSAGSWQDIDALYREDPAHRRHFESIRGRLDTLTFGVLDADGLAACIDEHLAGTRKHSKLLRHLLTHDAWVRRFGIAGCDA